MHSHALWSHSLAERIALFRADTIRVAYLAERAEPGTFRYRCINPVLALNAANNNFSASYFFLRDYEVIDDLSDYADVLVISRVSYDLVLDRAIRQFRTAGKAVYFDVDDLIVDPRFAALVASSLGFRIVGTELDRWSAFTTNIGLALDLADGVITSTGFLAARIKELVPKTQIWVVPNSLNQAQIDASEVAYQRRSPSKEGLSLGYFSGSPSHTQDFAVAAEALREFLDESPSSTLTVVGYLELPKSFRSLNGRLRRLEFMDFLELQTAISRVDVNLAPLQANAFTHSKSELKYFEAAAVGTVTLASTSPVFQEAIDHGQTGFLTENTRWRDALTEVEALNGDTREEVATRARADALARFGPSSLASQLASIFSQTN